MEEYKNNPENNPLNIPEEKGFIAGENGESNFNQEKRPTILFVDNNRKKIIIGIFIFLGILVLGAGAYLGFDFYEKIIRNVSVEKILPKDSNGVIKMNINPDSDQFQLLESNMQKFPGYGLLKKKIDESGDGKTITELFFEKLKEKKLDFEADIKPAIGEQAYVVFPDMGPLFENISRGMVSIGNDFYARAIDLNKYNNQDHSEGMVMGAADYYSREPVVPLDFIMASDIRDKQKAQEIIEKLKNNSEYEAEVRRFKGYEYIRIRIKNVDNTEQKSYLNYIETFHALLGGNWIMTSREDYMKETVDRRKEQDLLSGFISREKRESLAEDESFKKVYSEIGESDKDAVMFLYTKLNFEKIFGNNKCKNSSSFCLDTEYFKYPEDIINGFSLKMEPDGIKITSTSNKQSFGEGEVNNKKQSDSLATRLPVKAGYAWLDVLVEHNNLKSFYYNFKKNNLTEEGIQSLNDLKVEIKTETGIDFESDIIDILSGSVGFSLFTSAERLPEGVILADVSDKEKMSRTMGKLVEFSKNIQISQLEMIQNQFYSYIEKADTQSKTASGNGVIQALTNEINLSHFEETKIPEGTIFTYKPIKNSRLPLSEYLPDIVFSLEDNFMIFGSSYVAVETVLKGMKNKESEKLAESKYYSQAATKFYPENYFITYVNMFGFWNVISYYQRELEKNMDEAFNEICQPSSRYRAACSPEQMEKSKNELREYFFAAGAIFRTLNIISYSKSLGDQSKKETFFIHVKEIPQDEKNRAEKALEKLDGSNL